MQESPGAASTRCRSPPAVRRRSKPSSPRSPLQSLIPTTSLHGCCLLNDNLWWGNIMLAYQARPLDPQIVGPTWRNVGSSVSRRCRFSFPVARAPAFRRLLEAWLRVYDFGAITCPVLAIGGWTDSYTNAFPGCSRDSKSRGSASLVPGSHLSARRRAGAPIGYLQEAVRWWTLAQRQGDGHHGRAHAEGLRAGLRAARGTRTFTPGRWVGRLRIRPQYPSPSIVFAAGSRTRQRSERGTEFLDPLAAKHGKARGSGWARVSRRDPTDQRLDDGGALVFERRRCSRTSPSWALPAAPGPWLPMCHRATGRAYLGCRADGRATRVTYQVLNLTHRTVNETPTPLEPGPSTESISRSMRRSPVPARTPYPLAIATRIGPSCGLRPIRRRSHPDRKKPLELPVRQSEGPRVEFEPPARGP